MLRYYKKLEENFLNLSGLSKYLIYGVTEIILLVVGVVIALQVNNWGQQRNDRELEKYYLEALHEQVSNDIIDIERVIEHDSDVLEAINGLLTKIKENESSSDEASIAYIRDIFTTTGTNPNTIVFEDMKSSGRINLVSSPDLRFQIQEYYDYIEEAHEDVASNTQLMYRWYNDYVISKDSDINSLYNTISPTIVEVTPYEDILVNDEIINQFIQRLSVRFGLTEFNLARHFNSLEMANELKESLEAYLREIS